MQVSALQAKFSNQLIFGFITVPTTPSDHLYVPSAVWAGFRAARVRPTDVLQRSGLSARVLTSNSSVNSREYFSLWRAFSELVADPAAGIRFSESLEIVQMPPGALAAFSARNYREALHRMARYKILCAPEVISVSESEGTVLVEVTWPYADVMPPAILMDATLAAMVDLGRRGTGKSFSPLGVEMTAPSSAAAKREAFYGCVVDYEADRNCLKLASSHVDLGFQAYNDDLWSMLSPALDLQLAERAAAQPLSEQVLWAIKRTLPDGRPDLGSVASTLGVSARTLQRRMADEGHSFQALINQARHALAREYLSNPRIEIQEIVFLLGFQDAPSFYRAFRVWEGCPPMEWRSKEGVNL